MAIRSIPSAPCVALFDLDGTLTWRDTLVPYLWGYALAQPVRWLDLWRVAAVLATYAAAHHDRGRLKARLIKAVMGHDSRPHIEAWSQRFVAGLEARHAFRPAALAALEAHRAAGDHLVLLSASPDLYVPRIGELLGFERTLCTELTWRATQAGVDRLDGGLQTPNRRGEEKCACLRWLRTQYPNVPIVAYGNSDTDLPHLTLADRALLVNGSASARRQAATLGIAVANWT